MAPPRAVLFDLDGTLLQHDIDAFMGKYIASLVAFFREPLGVDVLPATMTGVRKMMRAPGGEPMADVYYGSIESELGHPRARLAALYEDFVANVGPSLGTGIVADPASAAAVAAAKALGARVALATHPVFPASFIALRVRWSGLSTTDFDLLTTLESARFVKPSAGYYRTVSQELGIAPQDCLMVGNDLAMDLVPAAEVGMRTCFVEGPYAVKNADGFTPHHAVPLAALPALLAKL